MKVHQDPSRMQIAGKVFWKNRYKILATTLLVSMFVAIPMFIKMYRDEIKTQQEKSVNG